MLNKCLVEKNELTNDKNYSLLQIHKNSSEKAQHSLSISFTILCLHIALYFKNKFTHLTVFNPHNETWC